MKNRGFILIFTVLIITTMLFFLIFLSQRLICIQNNLVSFEKRQETFYLASAGAARAEYLLKYDPLWAPTDPPFAGGAENLLPWLVKNPAAGGSQGKTELLTAGGYKIVREAGKNYFYSIGFLNGSAEKNPLSIIKVTFDSTGTYQTIKKEEI